MSPFAFVFLWTFSSKQQENSREVDPVQGDTTLTHSGVDNSDVDKAVDPVEECVRPGMVGGEEGQLDYTRND